MTLEHFDVLIVGAGLSGIGAALHLQKHCPSSSFAILEGRDAHRRHLGPVPLSRRPLRLGHVHAGLLASGPGSEPKAIADGPSILRYIRGHRARTRHRPAHPLRPSRSSAPLVDAGRRAGRSRSSAAAQARPLRLQLQLPVHVQRLLPLRRGLHAGLPRHRALRRAASCTRSTGRRTSTTPASACVVIGSGATAVTLRAGDGQDRRARDDAAALADLRRVAAGARTRSPTALRRWLPAKLAYCLTRWKNVLLGMYFYRLCQRKPEKVKRCCVGGVRAAMLGPDYDVAKHFTPRYKPWDQRLCLVPDGDLFRAIRKKQGLGRHRPDRELHRDRASS